MKSASLNLRESALTQCPQLGEFGKITLAQGGKIHLNQPWHRLKVPASQRYIPTQKFPEYLPRALDLTEKPLLFVPLRQHVTSLMSIAIRCGICCSVSTTLDTFFDFSPTSIEIHRADSPPSQVFSSRVAISNFFKQENHGITILIHYYVQLVLIQYSLSSPFEPHPHQNRN